MPTKKTIRDFIKQHCDPISDLTVYQLAEERRRQLIKWGELNHIPAVWLMILGEEFGEACNAILESVSVKMNPTRQWKDFRAELIQVATVAIAAVESYDRDKGCDCKLCKGRFPHLNTPIENLDIGVRSFNCLRSHNVYMLKELVELTESDLLKMKHLGRKTLKEIKSALHKRGLSLGLDLERSEWR